MLGWIESFLVKYPELTLFLVIGIGYWIGSFKLGPLKLGPVTGSLFAGIAVGQVAHVPVSGMAKSFLFLLFLFGIGYSVGPQFMQALKRDGLKPVALAAIMAVTGLLTAIAVAKLLGLDPGFAAGLLSGALTESPAMGTATEAINALPLPAEVRARYVAHIAVADAVCYLFGAAGMITFMTTIAPRLIGVDLVASARALEAELGITRMAPGTQSAWRRFEMRAYAVGESARVIGMTVAEIEAMAVPHRIVLHRIRRDGTYRDLARDDRLAAGDVVAVSGRREVLVELIGRNNEEVEDRALLDITVAMLDVLVTSRDVAGRTIAALASAEMSRGIYLRALLRGGEEIPVAPGTEVLRGDVLRIVGDVAATDRAAKLIGPIVRPTENTDFVVLGIAIFLGGLAGVLIAIPVGGMTISLSTSVGTLLAGLVVGHLRTRHPLFGRIPDGAIALMTALGLAAFVAMTGLHAGPIFFEAVAEAGIGLLVGGAVVTMMPLLVGLYAGFYLLKLHPQILFGAMAGAQTMTAAMAAVQERSESNVAVLGYTPAVPIGHILLTSWGTVIVNVMAG
ncbi:TrkA C-terminal domain-containing protein [Elioraea sp.]|uniref:aspartate-alanine antiporter-like transporter n=1 Tax=Elioraea sp. TaxID=2185103 RepID=UPI0025BE3F5B|nr:TrkA C-terminal domain-containing protein [Elioraea sp.]